MATLSEQLLRIVEDYRADGTGTCLQVAFGQQLLEGQHHDVARYPQLLRQQAR